MRLPLVRRGVRCIDCRLLQEQRPIGQPPGPRLRAPRGEVAVGLSERRAIERGTFDSRLTEFSCHVGFVDYKANAAHDPGTPWDGDQLERISAKVTRPRHCPHFCRFQPGNSPEKHLELKQVTRKTWSDHIWGFVVGVILALLTVVAKGWYDQLRSVSP